MPPPPRVGAADATNTAQPKQSGAASAERAEQMRARLDRTRIELEKERLRIKELTESTQPAAKQPIVIPAQAANPPGAKAQPPVTQPPPKPAGTATVTVWVRMMSGSAMESREARLVLLEENGEYTGKFTGTFDPPPYGKTLNKPFDPRIEFEFHCGKNSSPSNGLLANPCRWTSDNSGRSGYIKIFSAPGGAIEAGFGVNGFKLGDEQLEFVEIMRRESR